MAPLASLAAPAHSLTIGEGFTDPIGFHDPTPRFTWKLPAGVKRQTAYQLEVSSGGDRWDSGWVESDRSVLVPYGGDPFRSRQVAEWRVRYRDGQGVEHDWSEPARFEMGLLENSDWKASWIRPSQQSDPATEPVATLRRRFTVDGEIRQARLHVTARGLFELNLNGERVSEDHFANGWTAYDQRLDTLSYPVGDALQSGDNTLEVLLGSGWYAGRLTWEGRRYGLYGKHPELLLQLEIEYADGSTATIVSDGDWEGTFEGPIVSSSIYDGETYDARRPTDGWAPVVANAELGPARLTPKPFAPVRQTDVLETREVTEPEPGRFVFDLGQNIVGWPRIRVPVEKDGTLTLRFAEMLKQDGTLYTENYRSAKSTNSYTAAETGTIEWEPTFTFHGFRYVEISGLPGDAEPSPDWVRGVVLRSDLRPAGEFHSSHAKLNQLQSNIVWGWRGNALDIPTDCPQRDERLGWTGDAQVFCPTASFNDDCLAFWKSWLGSMRDDQMPDGRIPHVIPDVLPDWPGDAPGWMDAATIIPWELWVRTGDREVLEENYEMMRKLVGWYRSQSVDGLTPGIKGFGDWLQPYSEGTQGDTRRGDTPTALLGNLFYAHSAEILGKTARVLGKREDSRRFLDEAADVKRAFVDHYLDGDGRLRNAPETQTAYVLTIAFDIVPATRKQQLAGHLVRLIGEADGHLRTGFLGTPHLVRVLDETGHPELACELLFKESYPSWFFSINQGATTLWERWNSYSHEDGFGDAGMNSFNHYAYGAIGQWMYERLAGLAPDPTQPGYKHFFVRPLFASQLDSVSASHETPYGKASSSWQRIDGDGGEVELSVEVPPNSTASIEFPGESQSMMVAPGRYRFIVTPDGPEPARLATQQRFPLTDFGAVGDGETLNTKKIQAAIDRIAADGGGTLVVPEGIFLSGAIFLKPGVHLHLDEGAVLKGSTDREDYPMMTTRIEGHFPEWLPALVNGDGVDGLRLTGPGTLDGSGKPFWDEFWARRREDRGTKNLDVPRPRLALIQNSRDVRVEGLTFKDSGFWNLHLYNCREVLVQDVRFEVPDEFRCPSSDGTDIDSCQDVTIRRCHYRVDDDAIAIKGSKGPDALEDEKSPPVEGIHVVDCTFERGHGAVTLGSEATIVRDVLVERCRLVGELPLVRFKLRPDTPQQYENLHYRDITLEGSGRVFEIRPWRQYFDLKGHEPPQASVRDVTVENLRGKFGSLGEIRGTPGQTTIEGITLKDVDLQLDDRNFALGDEVSGVTLEDVTINGEAFTTGE